MKSVFLFLFVIFCLVACTENKSISKEATKKESKQPIKSEIAEEKVPPAEKIEIPTPKIVKENIYGSYVGMFEAEDYKSEKKPSYANKINVTIDSIVLEIVYGHSVVAGNARPFKSTVYNQKGAVLYFNGVEPGDNRYDGYFEFTLDLSTRKLIGSWWANDKNLAVTKRGFTLEKKAFYYDPNQNLPEDVAIGEELYNTYDEKTGLGEMITGDVLKINPSNTLLSKKDVENLYQGDLEVIRNSIYARHGYSFKNRRMRYVFDNYVDWYIPVKTNILADLTDLEKQNIDLLKRYEQHAEKYYDSFGR